MTPENPGNPREISNNAANSAIQSSRLLIDGQGTDLYEYSIRGLLRITEPLAADLPGSDLRTALILAYIGTHRNAMEADHSPDEFVYFAHTERGLCVCWRAPKIEESGEHDAPAMWWAFPLFDYREGQSAGTLLPSEDEPLLLRGCRRMTRYNLEMIGQPNPTVPLT